MSSRRIRWLVSLMLCWSLSAMAVPEVRVLIDVSGSMKLNDPQNLRIPALKLLTGLIPSGSKAGVWLFDQQVSVLAKEAEVSQAWQNRARASASRIHSKGLFTHLGAAIEKGLQGWESQTADDKTKRSLILLTDGMVDVNGDAKTNAAERQRILTELLPRLQAAKIRLHTVALSEQADSALLSELSAATDAWFLNIQQASELDRSFLKLFEQAVERDSLPLTDNRFQVDASINEFTLLVFRKPGSQPALLKSADGQSWTADKVPESIKWYAEASYDLITVSKPVAGEWSIQADIDPQNRVMVVSDLGMQVPELPNNLFVGESPRIEASLTEQDKPITRKEFLMNVKMTLEQQVAGNSKRMPVMDDGSDGDAVLGDGIFSLKLEPASQAGEWVLVTEARSPTFQRQKRQAIQFQPMPLDTQLLPAEPGQDHQLKIQPQTQWLKNEGLVVAAKVILPDGSQQQVVASRQADFFLLPLARQAQGSQYQITLAVKGQTTAGRDIQLVLPSLTLDVSGKTQATEPEVVAKPEPVPGSAEAKTEPVAEPVAETGSGLGFWLPIALVGNLILLLAGWLGYRWFKKRQKARQAELSSVLEE